MKIWTPPVHHSDDPYLGAVGVSLELLSRQYADDWLDPNFGAAYRLIGRYISPRQGEWHMLNIAWQGVSNRMFTEGGVRLKDEYLWPLV